MYLGRLQAGVVRFDHSTGSSYRAVKAKEEGEEEEQVPKCC